MPLLSFRFEFSQLISINRNVGFLDLVSIALLIALEQCGSTKAKATTIMSAAIIQKAITQAPSLTHSLRALRHVCVGR